MKNKLLKINLQMFADGEGVNVGNNSSDNVDRGNMTTYSFEQAEQIATARAEKASKSALTSYFQQQGMTAEEALEAFKDFKAKKAAQIPDVEKIKNERDKALAELESFKNRDTLAKLDIDPEFVEFVESKVLAGVTDKKDFETCAKEFVAKNEKYKRTQQQTQLIGFQTGATSKGQGSSVTKESIMNIKDPVARQEAIAKNIHLFQ